MTAMKQHTWDATAFDGSAVWGPAPREGNTTMNIPSEKEPLTSGDEARAPDVERHRTTLIQAARRRRPVFVESIVNGTRCAARGYVGAVHAMAAIILLNERCDTIVRLEHIRAVTVVFRARRDGNDSKEHDNV